MQDMEEYFFGGTDDVFISACPVFLEDESASSSVWGYYICFENNSDKKVQLVSKDWSITDENGNVFHDGSVGFKGELPELEPGESYEFTSHASVPAPNAVFYGSCKVNIGNKEVDIKMPTIELKSASKKVLTYN